MSRYKVGVLTRWRVLPLPSHWERLGRMERNAFRRAYRASYVGDSRGPIEAVATALAIVMDNSKHPLRLVAGIGLTAALLNLIYAAYVIAVYLMRKEVAPGWATLSLTSAGQFFALALMIAVLCEYVGRLAARLQDVPSYYVRGEETSTVMLERDRRNVVADPEIIVDNPPGRPLPLGQGD